VHLLAHDVTCLPGAPREQIRGLERRRLHILKAVPVRELVRALVEGEHRVGGGRKQVLRAARRLQLHQSRSRRNGLVRRSSPTVVRGPWPGYVSSGSGSSRKRRRLRSMSEAEEFGKS